MSKFDWPLQVDSHSLWDKIKISSFILKGSRLTQGELVKEYEQKWWSLIQSPYPPVMVSSGSTANILISMWIKHKLGSNFDSKKEVLVPAATWPTSINNWLMLGFKPVFFDISLDNYGMSYDLVKEYVDKNHEKIACIFPTSLIGMTFDLRLIDLAKKYGIEFAQDNCEASFNYIEKSYQSDYDKFGAKKINRYKICISALTTSSTSTYIGHYANSIEGGFIFPQTEKEYLFYLANRNHGMVRSLIPYSTHLSSYTGLESPDSDYWQKLYNADVDPLFDFAFTGNNFRATDLNAKFGLLDSNRWQEYMSHRKEIGNIWLNKTSNLPLEFNSDGNYPFSLPICTKKKSNIEKIKKFLTEEKIEYRSLVAGNLCRHTCYKNLGYKNKFPNADYLHENCMYIGIPNKLNKNLVNKISNKLKYIL